VAGNLDNRFPEYFSSKSMHTHGMDHQDLALCPRRKWDQGLPGTTLGPLTERFESGAVPTSDGIRERSRGGDFAASLPGCRNTWFGSCIGVVRRRVAEVRPPWPKALAVFARMET